MDVKTISMTSYFGKLVLGFAILAIDGIMIYIIVDAEHWYYILVSCVCILLLTYLLLPYFFYNIKITETDLIITRHFKRVIKIRDIKHIQLKGDEVIEWSVNDVFSIVLNNGKEVRCIGYITVMSLLLKAVGRKNTKRIVELLNEIIAERKESILKDN